MTFETSGTHFTLPNQRQYPLAPACIIQQQRRYREYSIDLPRVVERKFQVGFMQCTLNGFGAIRTPSGSYEIERGYCLLTNIHHELNYAAGEAGWEFMFMTFIGNAARVLIDDLCAVHGHRLQVNLNHASIRAMRSFVSKPGLRNQTIDPSLAARLAGNVLVHLCEYNAPQQAAEEHLVLEASRLMSQDLSDPPPIAVVAEQLNISREYLTRLFSSQLGLAPGSWLRQERMRHADLLLRSSGEPIEGIAKKVGFQSASAFIAAFRQHFGQTPHQWRKQDLGSI